MTPIEQIKALAGLDGWHSFTQQDYGQIVLFGQIGKCKATFEVPRYLTSRDAIVPVIEKVLVGVEMWNKFFEELDRIIGASRSSLRIRIYMLRFKATPTQLSEALLRATGKWKDQN